MNLPYKLCFCWQGFWRCQNLQFWQSSGACPEEYSVSSGLCARWICCERGTRPVKSEQRNVGLCLRLAVSYIFSGCNPPRFRLHQEIINVSPISNQVIENNRVHILRKILNVKSIMILQNTNPVHTPLLSWELYLLESFHSIQWYLGGWEVLGPDTHSELPGVHLLTFAQLEFLLRWHRPRHCVFDTGEQSCMSKKTALLYV